MEIYHFNVHDLHAMCSVISEFFAGRLVKFEAVINWYGGIAYYQVLASEPHKVSNVISPAVTDASTRPVFVSPKILYHFSSPALTMHYVLSQTKPRQPRRSNSKYFESPL